MNLEVLTSILEDIKYKDWEFSPLHIEYGDGDELSVFAEFIDGGETQMTRRWIIEENMTRSEVVQTCLAMVLLAEEHEAREKFRYKGKKIYGPHFDADALTAFAGKKENLSIG